MITAFAATETAIEAMKRGAFDYLLKPLDLHQLRGMVARAFEQSRLTHVRALIDDEEEPADATSTGWWAGRPRCRRSTRPSAAPPARTYRC